MTNNESRLDRLFDELVPATGKADSLAGELIRAAARIEYRFFNDGDRIGLGYGRETCNPAARFLKGRGDRKTAACINALWGLDDDSVYEEFLDTLIASVADYVERHPDLRETGTEDMFSHRDRNEDVDDDGNEDDDEEF